ncbi:ribonucleoside-triphosphate reductase class III catalytic subunit [Tissierella praeacuta DSM 18095]|uniref:Ribonucleoside-triphosphate reductase class III catalytic subunit n=1 Tax=Tissierella praeacuta DSM 18095 TaxID=1123404 RepID=A0A1M4S594_9FIRM|nr:anaerobic ribonucleoside triphosphate reductase [Tissierella praeacuta]TCU71573.1 ribonucleoside-triphosphate reductase class III catalytic subunit [Tissierella praeacuta]SHE27187.1 ribonucleoside-triphosphate reductase class III catalytic subunit [Tissierella praeacuta DSM 18095]SUP00828.1 Anaerobic ribonucleoside-triphosphate reductase [Tissierella praeacuta]
MITKIKKRDGREVPFNIEKISNAIFKAAQAAGGHDYNTSMALAEKVVNVVDDKFQGKIPDVEDIQDIVEKVLIESGHAKTAKEYILYRAERNRVREMNTRLMKVFEDLTFKDAKDVDIKRENANIDGDTAMGTMLKYGSESAKQFYDLFVLNPNHSKAHKSGDIHIHDLDFLTLTTTCCQIDIVKLFENGFCTGHGFLREPKDIQSYSALACIAIQSNQNDQHGGQSIPNFDYGMALGVKKTYIKQYRQNLRKAIELLVEDVDLDDNLDNVFKVLEEYKLFPTLDNNEKYREKEAEYLKELLNDTEVVEKIQNFAERNSYKDTDKRTFQAMEALIHNLNTMHSRAGAQIPFSSINYGTDTSIEGRMVIKNLLLTTEQGLGNGETPIFPIQIFKVKEGVNYNKEDVNYDLFKLACKVSSKRLFPNFSFIDAPFNLKYYKKGKPETEVAYMGCRTRVVGNVYDPSREIVNGRGNLSFTTINLPRLGIQNQGNIKGFYKQLDETIDLVIEQLIERFEIQASKKVSNFPFLMGQGVWMDSEKLSKDDSIREVLKHGTLSIGFIGLAECLKALVGSHHGESKESQELGIAIVKHMRDRMDDISKQYKMNFTLIGTPAEGTAGRFVKIDREIFGDIEGVTTKEYYTNSFHIPVYYKIKAIDKINLEAPYHELTNAGHITYVELDGDPSYNLDAFEKIVRAMKEAGIGYGSINHPIDRDPVCGYTGIIGDICPQCGREEGNIKFERIRRITGYLVGTLDRFNDAKKAEERDRVKHFSCSK